MSITDGQITLELKEHEIGFYLPHQGRQEGKLVLPYGALICGTFIGDLLCERGSVIIPLGAKVCGRIEAARIYIAGEITSDRKERSLLIGRDLVAGASTAKINADLCSRLFALHKPKIWGRLLTFEEAEAKRLLHTAAERGGSEASGDSPFARTQEAL